jgi:hypothetical protein
MAGDILLARSQWGAESILQFSAMEYFYSHTRDNASDVYDILLMVDPRSLDVYRAARSDHRAILDAFRELPVSFPDIELRDVVIMPHGVEYPPRPRSKTQSKPEPKSREGVEAQGVRLRSQGEVTIFNAIEQKRTELRVDDGILVLPAPSAWDGKRHWQPSLVVVYRGRVGVIQVGDTSETQQAKNMNQGLASSGIPLIAGIGDEDAMDDRRCAQFIDKFLDGLAGTDSKEPTAARESTTGPGRSGILAKFRPKT